MNSYFLKGFKGYNSWWRYFFVIVLVAIAALLIGNIPISAIAGAKLQAQGLPLTTENLTNFKLYGLDQNLGLFLLALPFVFGLIALLILINPMHDRTINDTLTGRNKFDFKRFFFAVLVWGGLMIISLIISYSINPQDFTIQFNARDFIILIFVSGIFITMQSAFEEILFRGYFQQGLAVLTRNTWFPLIVTSIIFGVLHISNPEVKEYGVGIMLPQYILLGLMFGICVIMDEGLEIAIGVHVVNNVLTSLLITHESSVFQTHALFKVKTVNPVYSLFELIAFSIIFLMIMHKKFKWDSFKKLFTHLKFSQENQQ